MAESPRSSRNIASPVKSDVKPPETGDTSADDTSTPVVVAEPPADAPVVPNTSDVPDPRTGDDAITPAGYAGRSGFEVLESSAPAVAFVDPKRIPADVTPAVQPDAGGDTLLAAAQAKAPNLTSEFVSAYGLTRENLAEIASGAVPPPPAIGPAHSSDLYLTPGGWTQTAPGVSLEAHAAQQSDRRA